MLNDQDIQKMTTAFSSIFATKQDFQKMQDESNGKMSDLITGVDGYAKKADDYFQEMVMLSHKVDRHEKWLLQIADKLGLKLEY